MPSTVLRVVQTSHFLVFWEDTATKTGLVDGDIAFTEAAKLSAPCQANFVLDSQILVCSQ